MNAQAQAEFKRADAQLQRSYQTILSGLPDAGSKEKLTRRQQAWLAFREAEADLAAD